MKTEGNDTFSLRVTIPPLLLFSFADDRKSGPRGLILHRAGLSVVACLIKPALCPDNRQKNKRIFSAFLTAAYLSCSHARVEYKTQHLPRTNSCLDEGRNRCTYVAVWPKLRSQRHREWISGNRASFTLWLVFSPSSYCPPFGYEEM